MNKNLLLFELIELDTRIWIEALGNGVQGYLREGVGWEGLWSFADTNSKFQVICGDEW